jgi:thiamine kinase-like enzyme
MIKLYEASISDYKNYYVNNNDIIAVLKKSGISDEVKSITRQPIGVANAVFKVETTKNTYIIKKYNYKVKFKLAEKLYDKYNQANIHCVSPLNKTAIKHNGKIFNIYNFIEGTCPNDNLIDYLKSFILVDRKTNLKNRITKKCDIYYKSLKKNCHKTILDETSFVIKTYEEIKNNPIFKECFINHGDISKTNLIYNQNGLYVIDFDETTIAPMLYDFAVVSVKFFIENEQLNKTLYDELIAEITKNTNYTKDDCNLVVKYYLCKILLEKFYLHTSNEIDIFSKEQQRDNFKVYYEILKSLN